MTQGRRAKHNLTFEEQLREEARRFRAAAESQPPGSLRDVLLMRVRQAETALQITGSLRSPGLPTKQMTEAQVRYST